MATYGSGIRIDSNIAQNQTTSGSITLYSVPSGKYIEATIVANKTSGSPVVALVVDGVGYSSVDLTVTTQQLLATNRKFGPGSVIQIQVTGGTAQVAASGVQFTN